MQTSLIHYESHDSSYHHILTRVFIMKRKTNSLMAQKSIEYYLLSCLSFHIMCQYVALLRRH